MGSRKLGPLAAEVSVEAFAGVGFARREHFAFNLVAETDDAGAWRLARLRRSLIFHGQQFYLAPDSYRPRP
mgnify:CR=1 FL=1